MKGEKITFPHDVKILHLSLIKEHFDNIKNGTKKKEYRDITEYYVNKLCNVEGDKFTSFKKFDIIRFYTGKYTKDVKRPFIDLQHIKTELETFQDPNTGKFFKEFVIFLGTLI